MSWNNIPGRAAYRWIYDEFLARAPHDFTIVEVGVALGKSLCYCAEKMVEMGRTDGLIIGVDAWAGVARNGEQQASGPPTPDGDWNLFINTMAEHCPEDARKCFDVWRAWSVEAAKGAPMVDLVILDADHTYEAVKVDIAAWLPRVKPGGWIGGDDYEEAHHPGVIQAVKEAFEPRGWPIRIHNQDNWGTWLVRIPE